MKMPFRLLHRIMVFVTPSAIVLVVMWFVIFILMPLWFDNMPKCFSGWFFNESLQNTIVCWTLYASALLNPLLFSVRYCVKRDCLWAYLFSLFALSCFLFQPYVGRVFYPGRESHPITIIEWIVFLSFLPYLVFNVYYSFRQEDLKQIKNAIL